MGHTSIIEDLKAQHTQFITNFAENLAPLLGSRKTSTYIVTGFIDWAYPEIFEHGFKHGVDEALRAMEEEENEHSESAESEFEDFRNRVINIMHHWAMGRNDGDFNTLADDITREFICRDCCDGSGCDHDS